MVQKRRCRATTCPGGCCPTGSLPSRGRPAVRCRPVYRPTLAPTSAGTEAGSCRLDGPLACAQAYGAYRLGRRTVGLAVAALAEGEERLGRVRGCRHWTRTGSPRCSVVPVDPYDRPYPATLRSSGRSPSYTASTTTARMVSSRSRHRAGRVGQLRHHRGPGDPWWARCDCFDRDFHARGLASGLDTSGSQCQDGGPGLGRTLAIGRTSPLCAVRQRQPFPRPSPVRRCRRARHATVSVPRHGSRVHPAQRDRLPSSYRGLQRPMASEGLDAVPAPLASRAGQPFCQVHRGGAAPPCRAHRIRPSATVVSQAVAAGPATASSGEDHLPATHRRPRPRQPDGTQLRGRSSLAASFGLRRGRPRRRQDPLLRPPSPRSGRPTPPARCQLRPPPEAVSGVTLIL